MVPDAFTTNGRVKIEIARRVIDAGMASLSQSSLRMVIRCCNYIQSSHDLRLIRHHGWLPSKDRPLVERHPLKRGVGWLVKEQEGMVCRFRNDMPTQHVQWLEVETRPLRGAADFAKTFWL